MKMHVIGDPDTVLGFALIGLTGKVATTPEEVRQALEEAATAPDIGVVFVSEKAAAMISEQMDAWRLNEEGPVVVEIPGADGPPEKRLSLRDIIARATGIRM